jgi:CheY-like chemotaxis protein
MPRETILVVDDEQMVCKLAARILVTHGYVAIEANGGEEAVHHLRRNSHRIDGVLTDLTMPGLNGRRLGETVARCWPDIRVLFMSGFAVNRMIDEGALDPMHPVLQKPFTSEQLVRKVRDLFTGAIEQ